MKKSPPHVLGRFALFMGVSLMVFTLVNLVSYEEKKRPTTDNQVKHKSYFLKVS